MTKIPDDSDYALAIHAHPDYQSIQRIEAELIEVFRKTTDAGSAHDAAQYIEQIIDSHVLTHWIQHYADVVPAAYVPDGLTAEMKYAVMRVYIDGFMTGAKIQAQRDSNLPPVPDTPADLFD